MDKNKILRDIKTYSLNMMRIFKVNLFWIVLLISNNFSYSQQILNGSFENNSVDSCMLSLDSQNFPNLVYDVIVIDTFGNFLDLIKEGCGWGDVKQGNYCLGIGTNIIDGDTIIEKIALKLSENLVMGEEYNFSYYFKGWDFSSLDVGVSETSNDFGILIQSSPSAYPDIGVWIKQEVNFIAPNNSSYITLRMHDTDMILDWLLIDDFKIFDPLSSNINTEDIQIFRVYPNPILNVEELSIEIKGLMAIDVFDTFGKKILSKKMNPYSLLNKINLQDLHNGIYVLKMILSNGQSITTKIVKQ